MTYYNKLVEKITNLQRSYNIVFILTCLSFGSASCMLFVSAVRPNTNLVPFSIALYILTAILFIVWRLVSYILKCDIMEYIGCRQLYHIEILDNALKCFKGNKK